MKQLNDLFNRFFATAGIILMLLCSVVPSTFAFQAVDMNVVPSNIEVVKVGSVTPISVATCVDSDVGGLNYNVYGYSQGNKEGTDKYSRYYDSCGEAVGDSGKDKGDYIAETHCSGTADAPYVHTQWYKCQYGCLNGACQSVPAQPTPLPATDVPVTIIPSPAVIAPVPTPTVPNSVNNLKLPDLKITGLTTSEGNFKATVCNMGNADISNFKIRFKANGKTNDLFYVPSLYPNSCTPLYSWGYGYFGLDLESAKATVFSATLDPDNTIAETNENNNFMASGDIKPVPKPEIPTEIPKPNVPTVVPLKSEVCSNGVDDDGDGYPDCFDADCSPAMGETYKAGDACTLEDHKPTCCLYHNLKYGTFVKDFNVAGDCYYSDENAKLFGVKSAGRYPVVSEQVCIQGIKKFGYTYKGVEANTPSTTPSTTPSEVPIEDYECANVNVNKCIEYVGGIYVDKDNTGVYQLINGCRYDPQHGWKTYKMSCNSATSYKACSKTCSPDQEAIVPTPPETMPVESVDSYGGYGPKTEDEVPYPNCKDPDGFNVKTKAWASGYNEWNQGFLAWGDYCTATLGGAQVDQGVYLHEAACVWVGESNMHEVRYVDAVKCNYGCFDGVCGGDGSYTIVYDNQGNLIDSEMQPVEEAEDSRPIRGYNVYMCVNDDSHVLNEDSVDDVYESCQVEGAAGWNTPYIFEVSQINTDGKYCYNIKDSVCTEGYICASSELDNSRYQKVMLNGNTFYYGCPVGFKLISRSTSQSLPTWADQGGYNTNYDLASCSGCVVDGKCLPIGTRKLNGEALFCDIDSTFKTQKSEGAVCSNSFECTSNFCTNGVCVDIEGQLKETKSMLERVINWLSKLF